MSGSTGNNNYPSLLNFFNDCNFLTEPMYEKSTRSKENKVLMESYEKFLNTEKEIDQEIVKKMYYSRFEEKFNLIYALYKYCFNRVIEKILPQFSFLLFDEIDEFGSLIFHKLSFSKTSFIPNNTGINYILTFVGENQPEKIHQLMTKVNSKSENIFDILFKANAMENYMSLFGFAKKYLKNKDDLFHFFSNDYFAKFVFEGMYREIEALMSFDKFQSLAIKIFPNYRHRTPILIALRIVILKLGFKYTSLLNETISQNIAHNQELNEDAAASNREMICKNTYSSDPIYNQASKSISIENYFRILSCLLSKNKYWFESVVLDPETGLNCMEEINVLEKFIHCEKVEKKNKDMITELLKKIKFQDIVAPE